MTPARSFKDLIVWRKAHQFVLSVYPYSSKFPREEIYVLTSQFRWAAISITANIAEGFAREANWTKSGFSILPKAPSKNAGILLFFLTISDMAKMKICTYFRKR